MELTQEQQDAMDTILRKVDESKAGTMRCLICNEPTYDRGLVCAGPAPATVIMMGLCYACKNLPSYEEEVQRCIREYLLSIGREDLL